MSKFYGTDLLIENFQDEELAKEFYEKALEVTNIFEDYRGLFASLDEIKDKTWAKNFFKKALEKAKNCASVYIYDEDFDEWLEDLYDDIDKDSEEYSNADEFICYEMLEIRIKNGQEFEDLIKHLPKFINEDEVKKLIEIYTAKK